MSVLGSLGHVALFATPDPFLLMRQQSFSSLSRTSQASPLRVLLLPTILLVPVDLFSLFLYVFHHATKTASSSSSQSPSMSYLAFSEPQPQIPIKFSASISSCPLPHTQEDGFYHSPPPHTDAKFTLLSEVASVLLETQSKRL